MIDDFQGHVVIPYQSVDKKYTRLLKGLNIKNSNGDVVGTVVTNKYNCGIALVDKDKLVNSTKFSIDGSNTILYDPLSLWESIRNN
jgi:hypothetical protein